MLLDAGCVEVRTDAAFILPSGWASPVYMDATRLISLPTIRRELMKQGVQRLLDAGALQGLSAVAGGESSGIAFAAWFAEKLDMPLQYVRKRPVGSRQIEGVVHSGGKVLLVDDMVSAGQYKLNFIEALRNQGARVEDLFVVFDYGCFGSDAVLAQLAGCTGHGLPARRVLRRAAGSVAGLFAQPRPMVAGPRRHWSIIALSQSERLALDFAGF